MTASALGPLPRALISRVLKPCTAVAALHSAAARVGGLAKRLAIPRSNRANVLFRDRPARFDWVQVRRVWREELDTSAACLDHRNEARVLVRWRVVEDDDVAPAQLWRKAPPRPPYESLRVRRAEHRAHRDPTTAAQGADHGEARAPVHRTRIEQDLTAANPGMRTAHREVRCSFVQEDEAFGIHAPQPAQKPRSLLLDVGPRLLGRTYEFFLKT